MHFNISCWPLLSAACMHANLHANNNLLNDILVVVPPRKYMTDCTFLALYFATWQSTAQFH